MRALKFALASALFVSIAGCGGTDEDAPPVAPGPAVTTGVLRHWAEAKDHMLVDVNDSGAEVRMGRARPTGLDAMWSIGSTTKTGGTAFFYADIFRQQKETRVARANVGRVAEIRDARALQFDDDSVGPVPVGAIVVIEHAPSQRYLAIVLDAIEPTDPRTAGAGPYAYADVRWYLTSSGSADFSSAH
jgi:hypothetical protein